ncbi:zinc-binding alcohol dehydrogenase [Microbacterium sp. CFBP9034]|uniref:zinc-dependent alcohol dehydrogenase n=1 Tax=Microbacterium sp. CFBP9034 TaxID=3096540 RepID=UPI002A69DB0D|nr:zinc-binding alcohol dehydrogenase [Microbacterium sp. CFBP9034]MDY0908835.1 zinc-binding alcohol dehydrogenase [Microbacterium sp. CFBP9034]
MTEATAFWVEAPGRGALRTEELTDPRAGEVVVRTLYSGISRGTEALVFRGEVPASERDRMRAPFQAGEFPGPVKYGYLNVGVVERGSPELEGRTVFTLFPHQSAFVVPESAVAVVPRGVPPRRAVLAGAVETAVNVLWDAAPLVGDRISVIGAGMIGGCVARLLAGIPGVDVVVVDQDPSKATVCEALGVQFATPDEAPSDRDLVIETSGSGEGLQLALQSAATEGEIIEASWFGDRAVSLALGGAFHSRRLTIRSSQVGMVAPRRRGTRTTADRLALALSLLGDPAFDSLVTGGSSWRELPALMAAIADGSSAGLCHTVDWRDSA